MLKQARLNLPEVSTFSFRTNTTDTPLNPHYPKIFEKKTRIETDEIVNHLSIYESTCICTCQKGLWDTKEMYTSCYNLNVWYQLNNLLSQYDYFNVYYGSSLLKTLIAYNLNTCTYVIKSISIERLQVIVQGFFLFHSGGNDKIGGIPIIFT